MRFVCPSIVFRLWSLSSAAGIQFTLSQRSNALAIRVPIYLTVYTRTTRSFLTSASTKLCLLNEYRSVFSYICVHLVFRYLRISALCSDTATHLIISSLSQTRLTVATITTTCLSSANTALLLTVLQVTNCLAVSHCFLISKITKILLAVYTNITVYRV
jgi:hypothetical protein